MWGMVRSLAWSDAHAASGRRCRGMRGVSRVRVRPPKRGRGRPPRYSPPNLSVDPNRAACSRLAQARGTVSTTARNETFLLDRQAEKSYCSGMNKLTAGRRAQILGMMAEGVSIRAITRLTGASKNTVATLLRDAGEAFSAYQDRELRNLRCKRLQLDELWSFVYAKQKNVPTAKAAPEQAGDIWTWVALDADTKLVASYYVGNRDAEAANLFVADLAERLAGRAQVTSDGLKVDVEAVERAFGSEVDYAMLVKHYGEAPEAEKRYSPAICTG